MRRLTLILAAVLLLAGCSGSRVEKPHLTVTPLVPHALTACALSACGAYAVTMDWGVFPAWGHTTTGYEVFCTENGTACDGTPYGTTTGPSYTVKRMVCGTTYTLGVQAHDSGADVSQTVSTPYTTPACSGFSALHVSGSQLLNSGGQSVFLHGVNRAGTEYSCIQDSGFFDGSGTSYSQEDAQVAAMASWGINAEMITLNEDCWLGINGAPSAYSSSSSSPPTPGCSASQCPYANAIENIVQTDEADHIYPVISLFAMAPGSNQSTTHIPLADNDHAPLFWEEVADFFKNDPYVIFRLEQEPTMYYGSEAAWECWSQGDVSYSTSSDNTPPTAPTSTGTPDKCNTLSGGGLKYDGTGYNAVGMQSLVNIVRGTGSTNIIMLPGLQYANMWSCGATTSPSSCGALASATPAVTDPHSPSQLMAEADIYPEGNECGEQTNANGTPSTSCYEDTYKPIADVMPFVAGEMGENPNNGYYPTTYVDELMNWLDANGNGYFPYAWDPWGNLIASYTGDSTPVTQWGIDYYDHINGITPPSPPQPTDGITIAQSATPADCVIGPVAPASGTMNFTSAVDAGDDLFAVFAGQGWENAASVVTGVSDNVNGAWTEIGGSGGSQADGNTNASYSVFELADSKAAPNGLTLTVTGTSGQSGASGIAFDTRGVASVRARSFQSTIQGLSSTYTGPTLSSVPAGDLVLGLWGGYSDNETYTASSPWNTHPDWWVSSNECAEAAMDWTQPTSTGNVTPSISETGNTEVHYGAAIDLQP